MAERSRASLYRIHSSAVFIRVRRRGQYNSSSLDNFTWTRSLRHVAVAGDGVDHPFVLGDEGRVVLPTAEKLAGELGGGRGVDLMGEGWRLAMAI